MTHTKLEKQYSDFWQRYTTVMPNGISFEPSERSNPFKIEDLHVNMFRIAVRVSINRLSNRAIGGIANMTVIVDGSAICVFDRNDRGKVTQSNVTVNYLRVDERRRQASMLKSLHYDYEIHPSSLRNHPIYHCQFSSDSLCGNTILGRTFAIDVPTHLDIEKLNKTIRIPTANMDIISVLLCIAADHCPCSDFEKVLAEFDKNQWHEKLPHIADNTRFSPGINFRSRTWYVG